jgi:hypothetical protein
MLHKKYIYNFYINYYLKLIKLFLKNNLHVTNLTNTIRNKKINFLLKDEINTIFLSLINNIFYINITYIYKILFKLITFLKNLFENNYKVLFLMNYNSLNFNNSLSRSILLNNSQYFMLNLKKKNLNFIGNYFYDHLQLYKRIKLKKNTWFQQLTQVPLKDYFFLNKLIVFYLNVNINLKHSKFNRLKNYHFFNIGCCSIINIQSYLYYNKFFDYMLPVDQNNYISTLFYFNFFNSYIKHNLFEQFLKYKFNNFLILKKKIYKNILKLKNVII